MACLNLVRLYYVIVGLCVVHLSKTQTVSSPTLCGNDTADIVFVIGVSVSSNSRTSFQKHLDFMTDFVKQFDVGPNAVQVGLVTPTFSGYNAFYLNTYKDSSSLVAAIQATPYRAGYMSISKALRYANYYQFGASHGARTGVKRVVIVIMDEATADYSLAEYQASQLKRKTGLRLIVIGIGNGTHEYEINSMATNAHNGFTIGSVDILHTLLEDVKDEACGDEKPTPTTLNQECGRTPADIVFVLDSSASEGQMNFEKQLNFVSNFVSQFQIGPQHIQISLVRFSSTAREIFPLDEYTDQSSLLAAITHVTYNSGSTATDRALEYVRQHSFDVNNGGRVNATHIVVVITDGQSNHPDRTETQASMIRNSTLIDKVVAIGIGDSVKNQELVSIATDQSHVLKVANFEYLQALTSELTFVSCDTCVFLAKADIVFLLDSSLAVGALNFRKQLDFISRVVNDRKIGSNSAQIGVVTASTKPHHEFYLNQYNTKAEVLHEIQAIAYTPGTARSNVALQLTQDVMFTQTRGDRNGAPNYVIMITDGVSANQSSTMIQADRLKQRNTVVIVIGVGSGVNKSDLGRIASDSNHVLMIPTFDALRTIREDIDRVGCAEVIPTDKPETSHSTTLSTTTSMPLSTISTSLANITTTTQPTLTSLPSISSTGLQVDCIYENQTFPDPQSCVRYYRCTRGKLLHESCPNGDYFNRSDAQCDVKQSGLNCIE